MIGVPYKQCKSKAKKHALKAFDHEVALKS